MRIQLFIAGNEIELDEAVQFALNRTFEELSNPVTVYSEYSKSVRIPSSAKNNKTFGLIFRADSDNMSLFDATAKNDFELMHNGQLVTAGYCRLNSIDRENGKVTYNITLFGQLGLVFQELKKITFDPNVAEPTDQIYVIDGAQYVDNYITKDLVYESWTTNGQTYSDLDDALDNDSWTSIYGFACSANSLNPEFESKSVQTWDENKQRNTKEFKDILEQNPNFVKTNIDADSIISDGLTPRQFGEFRSYYQTPFIYWNKLWQIFWKKALSLPTLSDYRLQLDSDWFTVSNPYYNDTVMLLQNLAVKDGKAFNNTYSIDCEQLSYTFSIGGELTDWIDANPEVQSQTEAIPIYETSTGLFNIGNNDRLDLQNGLVFNFRLNLANDASVGDKIVIDKLNAYVVDFLLLDENDNTIDHYSTAFVNPEGTELSLQTYDAVSLLEGAVESDKRTVNMTVNANPSVVFNKYGNNGKFKIQIRCRFANNNYPWYNTTRGSSWYVQSGTLIYDTAYVFGISINNDVKRSLSRFSLNDIWNNDYKPFDIILDYCKMFRLYTWIDKDKKIIHIDKLDNYFKNYTIEDWSDKVDYDQNYSIEPVSWDNKYVIFNYGDNETKRNKQYSDRYGVNYGELKLNTNYKFNVEEKKLFNEPLATSINATENVLLWRNIYDGNIVYDYMDEIHIDNTADDQKQVSGFGLMYFYDGLQNFEQTDLQRTHITDDTDYMQRNGKYCYQDLWSRPFYEAKYSIDCNTFPKLSIKKSGNICIWNIPKEVYDKQILTGCNSIFDNFWAEYIEERYNARNKKITCYAKLTVDDYVNFEFRKFVVINNVLYAVNKIIDFDFNNRFTKIELVLIDKISGYTGQ